VSKVITDLDHRQLHKDVAAVVINIDWGDKSPGAGHAAAGRTGGWATAKALCTFDRLRRCASASQSVIPENRPCAEFGDGQRLRLLCGLCLVPSEQWPQCDMGLGRGCGSDGGRLPSGCWQTAANAPGS